MRPLLAIAAILAGCLDGIPPQHREVPYNVPVAVSLGSDDMAPDDNLHWRLESKPFGSDAVLSSSARPPTFLPDRIGAYEVALYKGVGPSVAEIARVRYQAVNTAPELVTLNVPSLVEDVGSITFSARAADPNGDSVEITFALSGPPGANTEPVALDEPGDDSATAQFEPGLVGAYTLAITATDALGLSATTEIGIVVTPGALALPNGAGSPIYSRSRDSLVLAGNDTIAIYRTETRSIDELTGIAGRSFLLGPSDDGRRVVVSERNVTSELRLLDLDTLERSGTGAQVSVSATALIGDHIYFVGLGRSLSRLDRTSGDIEVISPQTGTALFYVPTRDRLYLAEIGGGARAYDLSQDPPVELWQIPDVFLRYASVDDSWLADQRGALYAFGDSAETDLAAIGQLGPVTSLAHSPERAQIATIDLDDTIRLHDDTTFAEIATLPVPTLQRQQTEPIAVFFDSPGRHLLVWVQQRSTTLSGIAQVALETP